MPIDYTYEIIYVNKEDKAMEIVYTSPLYGKLHVGARLPYVEETLEDIVKMYAPMRYWEEQDMPTLDVEVGVTGEVEEYVPPPPTPEEILRQFTGQIESWLDMVVAERGYKSMERLVGYLNSTNPLWAAEALAGIEFRDAVWIKSIEVQTDVVAGKRSLPTFEEVIAEMPSIQWPEQ